MPPAVEYQSNLKLTIPKPKDGQSMIVDSLKTNADNLTPESSIFREETVCFSLKPLGLAQGC